MVEYKGLRVLVIGGAGLIGSHVVDLLCEIDVSKIIIYDNFCRGTYSNIEKSLSDPRVEVFEAGGDKLQEDILDKAVEQSDIVIDLAALWLLQCNEYPRAAFETNIRGTFNVLEACRKHKIKRLIYSSSASVYGDAVEIPMTENHPYNNKTFYGATKIASEHLFQAYHYKYGLEGVCLRYMNVYGPRQDFKGAYVAVIVKMIDNVLKGKSPEIYGDGSQSYDFIHVEDVARANVLAIESQVPFGFYNVGTGIKTSIKEVTEMILNICNREDLGIKYNESGETFVKHRIGDIVSSKKDLNFTSNICLRDGLKTLINWRIKNETR